MDGQKNITRREFARALGLIASGLCLAPIAGGLSGCYNLEANLSGITDMGGRSVRVPKSIGKLFCTNPIGTDNLYFLARDMLAGWNFKPSGINQNYLDPTILELPSLGVWMGAGSTPDAEEIAMQDPDVLLCYWTCDDAGVSMADDIRDETGFPVVLLDYTIQALPESYRFVGNLIGRADEAESLAAFCEQKLEMIDGYVGSIPEAALKSVFLAQGTDGLSTDPVGSMHVTDALELIRTTNVADMPGTEGQGMGMPTVNLEQVITWSPDAVLVSEYTMTDYQMSDLYQEILGDENWRKVDCVASGQVFRIPQTPFTWFGRPPSAMRLLGCLWLIKILYPEYCVGLDIRVEAKEFFNRFFGESIDGTALNTVLDGAGV